MNDAHSLEYTLIQFYKKVNAKHPHIQKNIRDLQLILSKKKKSCENLSPQPMKQNESHLETEASQQEVSSPNVSLSNKSLQTLNFSWNFDFTFRPPHEERQTLLAQVHCNLTKKDEDALCSNSIFKIAFYSIILHYFEMQDNYLLQKSQSKKQQLYIWIQTIIKVRKAMVGAAHRMKKELGCKQYARIRYLDQYFIKIIDKKLKNQWKYLKLIVQEYDEDYIEQVFIQLHNKINVQSYLKSFSSQQCLSNILKAFNMKLTIVSQEKQIQQIGARNGKIHILVKRQSDGIFILNKEKRFFSQLEKTKLEKLNP